MQSPVKVSVSQIKQFMRCNWRWWYAYGPPQLKGTGSSATWLGGAVHLALEEYMEGRPIPDADSLAELMAADRNFEEWDFKKRLKVAKKAIPISSVGLDKLPPPGSVEVERALEIPCGDAVMICRIDMSGPGYIGDHKTTSNLSWARSVQEVENDIQLLTYAYAALQDDPPEVVKIELLYRTTKGMCHTLNVSAEVPWSRVEQNWRDMVQISDHLVEHKYDESPEQLTENINACGDFRGCDHREYCPHSPKNRNKNLRNETMRHSERTQKMRDKLGLSRILPPDAPPNVEQTPALAEDAARAVAEAPPELADKVYNDRGVAPENRGPLDPATKKPSLAAAQLKKLSNKLMPGTDILSAWAEMSEHIEKVYGKKLTDRRWKTLLKNAGLVEFEGRLADPEVDRGGGIESGEEREHLSILLEEPVSAPAEPVPTPAEVVQREILKSLALEKDKSHKRSQELSRTVAFDMLVLVDCFFEKSPPGALTLSEFTAGYKESVAAQSGVSYYELIEYNEGSKQIAGKLMASVYKEHPTGVLLIDSGDPLASRVLSILRNCDGVAIVHGR